ncbi:hypothetical protein JK364_23485 [Streptomyces sp. 110]|uniref:Uncharacterized protein n=1 Tax=Streptomyces endocoffeicus TaxID=2898945 RepID=A0ABS1PSD1_9ACTN|nr:hypothetical protein [Streptomyces endocoffeicus]MBL1115336.1 hypothetical protein [Streptomyces endocoffeicus]
MVYTHPVSPLWAPDRAFAYVQSTPIPVYPPVGAWQYERTEVPFVKMPLDVDDDFGPERKFTFVSMCFVDGLDGKVVQASLPVAYAPGAKTISPPLRRAAATPPAAMRRTLAILYTILL